MQPILSKDNLLFSPPLTDVSNYLDAIVLWMITKKI